MNTLFTQIIGTWFIIGSNFPMWLKGDKQSPSFTYTQTQHKGKTVLLDKVKYVKKGKTKTITGYDRLNEKKQNAFIWRGKGLLAIAKSNWEIKLMDPQGSWAVIWFSKTLFTPEGIDIISRRPQLDEATLLLIKNKIMQDPLLKKQLETLKILK